MERCGSADVYFVVCGCKLCAILGLERVSLGITVLQYKRSRLMQSCWRCASATLAAVENGVLIHEKMLCDTTTC